MQAAQIRTKKRVSDHGEVLTGQREVKAMLDLVKQEAERIDARFLEPACGDGNFLSVILERKLAVVEKRYSKSQLDFERYAVLAVSSIYGIDILTDNVCECRRRLFEIFEENYTRLFKATGKDRCREAVRFILERNIVWGDALTLRTVDEKRSYIVFSEWSPVNGSMLKRRDFTFSELLRHEGAMQAPLFPGLESEEQLPLFSDLGEHVFIPTPVREYRPVHFMEIARVSQ
jgi:hypothetical protein